jgi:hypothetical protein
VISERAFTIYSFASIGLMLLLLVLLWFDAVDRSLYIPLFLGAIALFVVRMILRIVIARRRQDAPKSSSDTE